MQQTPAYRIYLAALTFGLLAAVLIFPSWALLGRLPAGAPLGADFATHVIGQRYFFAEPWHWPPLVADKLERPYGVNIAFTDSIPLAAVIAKLLRPILLPFDQVITVWQALCWVLQPAAAVFALRSMGERRAWTAACIALMSITQPIFVTRLRHAALCSQFSILLMLGLYFRIVRGSRAALAAACLLAPITLLVHPYIAVMNMAVLAAAPLTLLLRRDRAWVEAALGLVGAIALLATIGIVLGYSHGVAAGGFGFFSMNLASPFYPGGSALFMGLPMDPIDATGGQFDAPAYLGAGLILLLLWTVFAARQDALAAIRRHSGLFLCCAALFAIALSHKVYFFHILLFRLHTSMALLEPLRSSGRMFWPVTYVLLLGSVVILLRTSPRRALTLLPLVTALQVADGRGLIIYTHFRMREQPDWQFDPKQLRGILANSSFLNVLPPFGCNPHYDTMMQVLWIGSETLLPTNTAYVGRLRAKPDCDLSRPLADPPGAGEIRVIQPGYVQALTGRPYAVSCRMLSDLAICMQDQSKLGGLPPLP